MGRYSLVPDRKPFCSYRRAIAFVVAAFVFLGLGIAIREAEANQIGSSDIASMWTFVISGLCLYAAIFIVWMKRRSARPPSARRLR